MGNTVLVLVKINTLKEGKHWTVLNCINYVIVCYNVYVFG